MRVRFFTGVLLFLGGMVVGCTSERGTGEDPSGSASDAGELVVEHPWARPGSDGGMSALYFQIENGTSVEDTLQTVRTDAADTVEIHESYENEDGTRGMRPAGPVRVPAGERVAFAPGELHVMLIRLNRTLQASDSLAVELEFAQAGSRSIRVPVRMQSPMAP